MEQGPSLGWKLKSLKPRPQPKVVCRLPPTMKIRADGEIRIRPRKFLEYMSNAVDDSWSSRMQTQERRPNPKMLQPGVAVSA